MEPKGANVKWLFSLLGLLVTALGLHLMAQDSMSGFALADRASAKLAPEITHKDSKEWLNSAPLKLADLRGKVVIVDFWSLACWNCYRSFPWLNGLQKRLEGRDFAIVGVHTPEFESEHDRSTVERKAAEYGLSHPIVLDNDRSYWEAMDNRYWPAWFLLDKGGRIRAVFVGETHTGDKQSAIIEDSINRLLQEPA